MVALCFINGEELITMPGWTKLAEVNLVPLQAAVFCAECEQISDSHSSYCAGCGSRALVNLSRVLGGSLQGQNTARLIADAELDRLVREVISTVPEPIANERYFAGSRIPGRHHLRTNDLQGELELAYPLPEEKDLGELDLDPTISLIAERAQIITAATGAAVALRRGGDIVCRARAGRTAPDLGVRLQADSGLSAECVRTGEVLLCGDAEANPRVDLDSCRRLGVRSILVAPLRYFRRTLGLFEVLSSAPYAFDRQDIASMQMLAGLTVAAISRRARHAAGMPAGQALP